VVVEEGGTVVEGTVVEGTVVVAGTVVGTFTTVVEVTPYPGIVVVVPEPFVDC